VSGPEAPPPGAPSEDELRAAYEAELARISATDMIAQAAVSLLNIGARRIGGAPASSEPAAAPGGERDLEQVRDSIDAAMALLGILERRVPAEQLAPLRDALSRLQMAYAAEVRSDPGADEGGAGGADDSGPGDGGSGGPGAGPAPDPGAGGEGQPPGPGPAESSGRLWVPGR
jgi:hypothetical protein